MEAVWEVKVKEVSIEEEEEVKEEDKEEVAV